ncbi:uncharacterized protein GLRG_11822 [Colletotrichum graminicola M1.001]|uniref:Uncharacterized protein n=1 Tax=Colletotrichum graminicola (strain M1.001 / M2 / FGSC 10212) TaxID=645133 RepID=E3R0N8_COLGM|nr:uncharacterized protein GLRG_11822 [Colletotrichum graminicola M1.001]EFQ36676.1 hypothetical protein GLRG_11822 [Colletotrichum graminicola M1.001]
MGKREGQTRKDQIRNYLSTLFFEVIAVLDIETQLCVSNSHGKNKELPVLEQPARNLRKISPYFNGDI